MRMDANFKLINNALKCNPLNPFVQLIKFSNLNRSYTWNSDAAPLRPFYRYLIK